ncbi:phosphatase PAP2 family protein [Streptomyces chilikensis]|uniref:phosphatase PAP2 family protein n=1 Tax=Streptomyces chilikensis TaxID=1194079 RepID=UPI0014090F19|nr:phosphatase PAP2 family protein [Streptomyces chilikensis]
MAGLAESGSNPDVGLLFEINGLAEAAPTWFDRTMEYVGEYGLPLAIVVMGLWCLVRVRRLGREGVADRRSVVASVAAIAWMPVAAMVAVIVNIPIRGFVERPRPFLTHRGLEVLVEGKEDYSFVSDHATLAMAMAVALFLAHRKFGVVAIVLAVLAGLSRVYMGVHYPTDVAGGFALGTAVALLLSPVAMTVLTPLVGWLGRVPGIGRLLLGDVARDEDRAERTATPSSGDRPAGGGDARGLAA